MAIGIIFGTGGSGKSFFQVMIVIRKLLETRQNICTNLALDLPRLQQYIEERYPKAHVDVAARVRILTKQETMEFWKYRGVRRFTWTPENEYGDYVDDPGTWGVCYIIDEAGASGFDSVGWATLDGRSPRGVLCAAYLDQQRKYSDDVFASTNGRYPSSIAKPFRDKAHEFIYLKNESQTKLGPFRGASRFKRRHYYTEPSKNTEPYETVIMSMDWAGIGSCYRTQDGVGVSGLFADKGRRAAGISIYWVFPLVIVIALSVIGVPYLLGRAASSFVAGGPSKTVKKDKPGAGVSPVEPDAGKAIEPRSEPTPEPTAPSPGRYGLPDVSHPPRSALQQQVWALGYSVGGGRVNVVLSDGRTLTEEELSRVTRNYVESATGERYYIKSRFAFLPSSEPLNQ